MPNDPLDFSHFEQSFAQQQAQKPKDFLNLRFYVEPVQNNAKSLVEGRPIFDEIEFVAINVPGSKDEVIKKINAAVVAQYPAQYAYWKKTQEQPVDGTPLTMVPFLGPGQIREYQALNIKTLEQLANLSDAFVQKIGMGGLEARKKAQAYMKAGTDNAQLQQVINENERLKRDIEVMKGQIAQVNTRYETMMAENGVPQPVNGAYAAPAPSPQNIEAMIEAALQKMFAASR